MHARTHTHTHACMHTHTHTHTQQIHQDLLFSLCRLHPASGHTDSHCVRPSVHWKGGTGHGTGDAEQHRCLQGTSRAVSSHRYYNDFIGGKVHCFCFEFCISSCLWTYKHTMSAMYCWYLLSPQAHLHMVGMLWFMFLT